MKNNKDIFPKKAIYILTFLMYCFSAFSQELPKGYELLIPSLNSNSKDSLIFDYSRTSSDIFNDMKKPYILFFSFLECTGCHQVKNMVLNPNYEMLKKKFNLEIHCIVRLVDKNKIPIVKEYYNNPYPVYLDKNDLFFKATSYFVAEEKYKIARPRLLLVINGKVKRIPSENVFPISNLINYLDGNI
jgi:cytochrome c551/c552